VPVSNTDLTVGNQYLVDELPFQYEPFRVATNQLQPRLLIADSVGLGKTIEVGILLAELQRRGRANRVLVVVPRHILDQLQHELWCRFGFPLIRLDSEGIQRVHQRVPAGQNPFAYFNRVIVSIDTLKHPNHYRHHLEKVRWDVIWIDESHKLVNKGTLNNKLAKVLAPNADSLILTSATPHNGKPESFAELISLLDPTSVPNPDEVTVDNISHLVVRRHKHSSDVQAAISDHWAERAEPVPIAIIPSPKEEVVFVEISATWLNPATPAPCNDSLFPYTLLKAALSSPIALSESIDNRLKRLGADESFNPAEKIALRRLLGMAKDASNNQSAKLRALIQALREIGIAPDSKMRAVVFSERISTLDWIAHAIQSELEMTDEQVQTFHNSKNEDQQQRIIESFSMASDSIRVLVTSDIASEGVNLHKQCHQLIHFDLPWSLITLEQRNGRIDRYGQLEPPEIRYLIYNPHDPGVASDIRIVAKLIEKENAAHKALGDAASVMGLHSETAEQEAIVDALRKRTEQEREAAFEQATSLPFDPWAFAGLTNLGGGLSGSCATQIRPIPSVFSSVDDYLRSGLRLIYGELNTIGWEIDDSVMSFSPPSDLVHRLDVLPQSYLRQRNIANRLRLTSDTTTANLSLEYALNATGDFGDSGTAWPEVHYLGPQHPVLDWLADKILYLVSRNEAIAIPCNVETPTVLISGVWSNLLGEPIATSWLAATVEDDLVTFADMFGALTFAGVGEGMVNPISEADLGVVTEQLQTIVLAAKVNLAEQMAGPLAEVTKRLADTKDRLEQWQRDARESARAIRSLPHQKRRLDDIEKVTRQIEGLIDQHTQAQSPLIRVIGALIPRT